MERVLDLVPVHGRTDPDYFQVEMVICPSRPPQDVDILTVLDFHILCFRLESPVLYPMCVNEVG